MTSGSVAPKAKGKGKGGRGGRRSKSFSGNVGATDDDDDDFVPKKPRKKAAPKKAAAAKKATKKKEEEIFHSPIADVAGECLSVDDYGLCAMLVCNVDLSIFLPCLLSTISSSVHYLFFCPPSLLLSAYLNLSSY